ncbi:MAG: hypothetical protein ACK47B_28355 [Armatimonadota bacterium]
MYDPQTGADAPTIDPAQARVAAATFSLDPLLLQPSTRERVLQLYPALAGEEPPATANRQLLQYLLTSSYREELTGRLIVPHATLAAMWNIHPHSGGFRSGRRLREFEEQVLPLHERPYDHERGLARTVEPEFPTELLNLLAHEIPEEFTRPTELVDWVTGRRMAAGSRDSQLRAREHELLADAAPLLTDHPARELVEFLNAQPLHAFNRVLRANWGSVRAEILQMPRETDRDRRRLQLAAQIMLRTAQAPRVLYRPVENSVRIYPATLSVNQLPRELRAMLFRGAIQLDLRSCQLAIVSKLWGLTDLQRRLGEGWSIWEYLLDALGVTDRKPILKISIYSILFGGNMGKIRQRLACGTAAEPGIGESKAREFEHLPQIEELLEARKSAMQRVRAEDGVRDAFGRWIALPNRSQRSVRSLLSQQTQSYELRLMRKLWHVIREEKDLRILAWLHDGVILRSTDRAERERQIHRIGREIQAEAMDQGIPTELERKDL